MSRTFSTSAPAAASAMAADKQIAVHGGVQTAPHSRIDVSDVTTFHDKFGGATLQAQAGVRYEISAQWPAFAEYKGNYAFVNVPINSGDHLKTGFMRNALDAGISRSGGDAL